MSVISVVISAHNTSSWIAETLDSILAQARCDVELIDLEVGKSYRQDYKVCVGCISGYRIYFQANRQIIDSIG